MTDFQSIIPKVNFELWHDIAKSQKILEKMKSKKYSIKFYRTLTNNSYIHTTGIQTHSPSLRTVAGYVADIRNRAILNNNEGYLDIYFYEGWGKIYSEVLKDLEELGWSLIT